MNDISWLGCSFALMAALAWGCGDFTGGIATKKTPSHYFVLSLSALSGALLLFLLAVLRQESFPSSVSLFWAAAAGAWGTIGLGFLYRGLSQGSAAVIAPISAVVSAAIPVIYHIVLSGVPPTLMRQVGIACAIMGIWLLAPGSENTSTIKHNFTDRKPIFMGIFSGIGFGGFYIFLSLIEPGSIFIPLVVARGSAFIVSGLIFLYLGEFIPGKITLGWAILAGLIDGLGNLFFLLAKNLLRLDLAVVLSSLYPAITVILASVLLKQNVRNRQKLGVILCLFSIGMILV